MKLVEPGGKARKGEVPASGLIRASGMIREAWYSLFQPGRMVTAAGFQNIDERPPDPEAAPAKDWPCAVALCSRTAKPPAWAAAVAANKATSDTPEIVRERGNSRIGGPLPAA